MTALVLGLVTASAKTSLDIVDTARHTAMDLLTLDPSASFTHGTELPADQIRALAPRDERQQTLRTRALEVIEAMLKDRWMVAGAGATSVPVPYLVILLFWLTMTFTAFGLLAPRNTTVLVVLLLCAVSVSSAIFLVLEMDGPFDGMLKVSPGPLHYAHAHLNQ